MYLFYWFFQDLYYLLPRFTVSSLVPTYVKFFDYNSYFLINYSLT